ncbi:MAG TPA: hypothetical protein VMZ26_11015 [Pyrinomonadaceae bacterium]|nr:hypothetical protein [Pyrinomonadaceae bacterium]
MRNKSSLLVAMGFMAVTALNTLAGGVTNIKEVVNNSSKVVIKLTTFETKFAWEGAEKKTTGVITYGNTWTGDMWVPWADDEEQFKGHFMSLEIIELRPTRGTDIYHTYIVYQRGEDVRGNFFGTFEQRGLGSITSGNYVPNAPRVPGEWRSGGDRRVVVFDKKDGSAGFRFEKLGR